MIETLRTNNPKNWGSNPYDLIEFLERAERQRKPIIAEKTLEPHILPISRKLPDPPKIFFKQVIPKPLNPNSVYIVWRSQTTLDYVHSSSKQEEPTTLDSFV